MADIAGRSAPGRTALAGARSTGSGYESTAPAGRQQPGRHRARARARTGAPAGRDRLYEIDLLRITAAGLLDLIVQSQWSHYFIAGMALCLIYRTGLCWQLGAILVIAYANAVYQAIGFAQRVSGPSRGHRWVAAAGPPKGFPSPEGYSSLSGVGRVA